MDCPACRHPNDPEDSFCGDCGARLLAECPQCGAEIKPGKKFCTKCGAAADGSGAPAQSRETAQRRTVDYTPKHLADKILQSKSALEGERKQVTVLFADIQGSMQLADKLDPEHWHEILERYFAILTDAVHRFEGTVNQYTGDGIMALFGAPIAHEDHAQRACYSALQARDNLRAFADELRVTEGLNFSFRMGLNSGDVVVGSIGDDLRMDYTAQGATVGIAQRIEQLAAPGHVYLSGATEHLAAGYFQLRAMGETDLKGIAEAVSLFELEASGTARSRLDVAVTRGLSRFVGRTTEMQTLEAALAHAESGHGQVVGIVGEPGLGKSRLCLEFIEHCRRQGLPVFEAHCPAHGKNIPYLPILELFRNYFDIRTDDNAAQARKKIAGTLLLLDTTLQETLPVLFEFMGVGGPNQPSLQIDAEAKQRQLYELINRIVHAQDAQGQLTVTLVDDLHWVDEGSDGFVNQLVGAAEGHRNLIVLNFRPEYRAAFAAKAYYQQLPLVPLGDASLREMIAYLIGCDDSVIALTDRIVEWTTGNPFYTEELINTLVETGDLAGPPGHYRLETALERLAVPTNVRAVLSARIDRLPDAAKRLLQTAAVIGKAFSGPLLEAVSDLTPGEYAAALERLKAGSFIHERALYPVFEYAFKHPLTHEVSAETQLLSRRKAVHAAVARALEAQAGDKLDERAALLAHHCEAADDFVQAARWHQRAAEWAGMNDINAALRHWLRVRELAQREGDDDESTTLLAVACSRALQLVSRMGASATSAAAIFEEGSSAAERAGNLAIVASLNVNFGLERGVNQALGADYLRYTTAAVRIADRSGDVALRVGTRSPLAWCHLYCGQLTEIEQVADEVIALACGDIHLGAGVWGNSPLLAVRNARLHAIGHLRDPATALAELPRVREAAIEAGPGCAENAVYSIALEMELRYALGKPDGIDTLIRIATQLEENQGALTHLIAAVGRCDALARDNDWSALLAAATGTLHGIQKRGVGRNWEPRLLALIGTAHVELGDPAAGRNAARDGVALMRGSQMVWNPHSYAVLARAQLGVAESSADITSVLDEHAALLTRSGFHVYEGELHELRARLAAREARHEERAEALIRAHDCYTRFGMSTQAERVAAALNRNH